MDRINISKNGIVGVCFATALLLAAAQSFGAITNSFFDSDSQLSGWQYDDNGGVMWVSENLSTDGTGAALLLQPNDFSSSRLWQPFLVDDGSTILTFSVRTPGSGTSETDHLYVGLFDGNTSLLGNSDGFFHWDSDEGILFTDSTVNVNSSDMPYGWVLHEFTVPVSLWGSRNVTLQFTLTHEEDELESSVLVDNVVLHGALPAVPVPGAMGLAISGLAAMGVFARKLA